MCLVIPRFLSVLAWCCLTAGAGLAQCRDWSDAFALPGVDILFSISGEPAGEVHALEVWDDGAGPALYLGGTFRAGGTVVSRNVVRWDGDEWSAPGGGLGSATSGGVTDFAVHDDGAGEALFACGPEDSNGRAVHRWDGTAWSPVGSFSTSGLNTLHVFDSGTGPLLYTGGRIGNNGVTDDLRVWDGVSWQAVPGWVSTGTNNTVNDLETYDDGNGPALFVSGSFLASTGSPGDNIARFDGSSWSGLPPTPVVGTAGALAVFEDGGGERLVVGVGSSVLAWDGTAWSDLGSPGFFPQQLFDDGNSNLHAVGSWSATPAIAHVARWTGAAWVEVAGGTDEDAFAIESFDGGDGPELIVAGAFTNAGGTLAPGVARLARLNGSAWAPLQGGSGSTAEVHAMVAFDDGSGSRIHAEVDLGAGPRIMRWDGAEWTPLGGAPDGRVHTLFVHDSGGGAELYAGGLFTNLGGTAANRVARWDGAAWQPLGAGLDGMVRAMTTWDPGTGTVLVVAGAFANAGGAPAQNIAFWDGGAWSTLVGGPGGVVLAVESFDDGTGNRLYAAGSFSKAGGNSARNITRWDGAQWVPLLGGTLPWVTSLQVWDDGGGEALFVGGQFTLVNNLPAKYVARWNGTAWSIVGAPGDLTTAVEDLVIFDDGSGPALWTSTLQRWDGTAWTSPTSLTYFQSVGEVAVRGTGSGSDLFLAGDFFTPEGTVASSRIASWEAHCDCPPVAYCTAGTSANGCQALLSAAGVPSSGAASGFTLSASGAEGQKFGLFFFGTAGRDLLPWGSTSSFKCVAFPAARGALISSSGTSGTCDGSFTYDLAARWTAKPNQNPGPGAVVQAQLWFRDPAGAGNPKTAFSDALEFTVCP